MNDSKNMILAVAISALILLGWTWASNRYFPPANPPASTKVVDGKQQPLPQAQAGAVPNGPKALRSRAAVLGATPRVRIETPSLQGSLNLKGAQIDDLLLLKQRQTIDKNSPPVRLLSPLGAPGAYFASFGWSGQGVQLPGADTVWTASAPVLSPGKPVTLSWTNPTGQRFEQIISIDDDYLFSVKQRVVNGSSAAVTVRPFGLVSRATKSADPTSWTNHVGPIGFLNDKANYKIDWKTLDQAGPNGEQFTATAAGSASPTNIG